MNTETLIDQLNMLVDQAPSYVVDEAFSKATGKLNTIKFFEDDVITKKEAAEIITNLIQDLDPARDEIKNKPFTHRQLEAAMFNITREISQVDEYTDNPDVIDYAEHLARKIMYATPDTCEH